ncbi:hypothetical protein DNTS_026847 [Danionella cerebrum]|uniref:Ig-like domain-containing protein n=1 Tax=Danionella cerebrum TaxID=2873325 RepID=A0A553NI46_9TELE|nr:hypothetical protein DNTS_026847 [Danionella translucida]
MSEKEKGGSLLPDRSLKPALSLFLSVSLPVLLSGLQADSQTEMKRVVGDNATLPCHHQLWQTNISLLDIEWMLHKSSSRQKALITYFAGRIYDPNESEAGRLSLAGDYLKGDASLLISDLSLSDSGDYICKVKNGGKYYWNNVKLIVLLKPSKPRCWMEGRLLEGSDVRLSCKSSDGSDPISYKWERVLDKGKYAGKLPPLALIDLKNPEIVTLKNLTKESAGLYKCTASNDVGEEHCNVEVKVHYVRGMGVVAGAVVGVSFGVLFIILIIWLVEDAEAPKAKLVKPNSLSSSRSGSSRSGASSTQSMVHNSAPRGPKPRLPVVNALKESGVPDNYPPVPPPYNQVVPKHPELSSGSPKPSPANLARMGATPVMIPAQTKAFQTV